MFSLSSADLGTLAWTGAKLAVVPGRREFGKGRVTRAAIAAAARFDVAAMDDSASPDGSIGVESVRGRVESVEVAMGREGLKTGAAADILEALDLGEPVGLDARRLGGVDDRVDMVRMVSGEVFKVRCKMD